MACNFCSVKVLIVCFCICEALFALFLVLALTVFPDLVNKELNKQTRLEEGTEQFDRFQELPFALDFKIYLFEVTNPDEVLNNQKPKLKEVGPFFYEQRRNKTILSTNEDDDTITYTQTEYFTFNRNKSIHDEDYMITTINPALISVYGIAEDIISGITAAGIADKCLRQTFVENHRDIFVTLPVKDVLFGGYKFCVKELEPTDACFLINQIICGIVQGKRNIESTDDGALFSYLRYKMKDDGVYTVNRGFNDGSKLGTIQAWNYETRSNFWSCSECDDIKGTDSTLYAPKISKDDTLYIFSTDICRTVPIIYNSSSSYKDIDGYLYKPDQKVFYDSSSSCYCANLTKDINEEFNCYLDGLFDVFSCFSAPLLLSMPHFLWADKKYQNNLEGIKPVEENHTIYLLVEPNTGIPLKGAKRVQYNLVIRPFAGVRETLSLYRAVLPLFWAEESVELPQKYVDQINNDYFDKVHLVDGVKWALVGVFQAVALLIGGFALYKRKRMQTV